MDQTDYQQLPESPNDYSSPFHKTSHKNSVVKSSNGLSNGISNGHYQNGTVNQGAMELQKITRPENGHDEAQKQTDRSALIEAPDFINLRQISDYSEFAAPRLQDIKIEFEIVTQLFADGLLNHLVLVKISI
ncbi:uncharacterized protein TRIADDRAFT_54863 [Trichoplax adhaerens]|uniref:Uncharacterized protein n=1 Tax=Trichoplax adhaerens TaxID=10228 RepID=B3RT74_TRIAD|nr:predicted protein [Trichoplax adhaerens]EDV26646.1 predicted protein [Trichoplax adhaerens]|eukprot:XP_002110642.1 predicted protein [Trichoplax adhaerens]